MQTFCGSSGIPRTHISWHSERDVAVDSWLAVHLARRVAWRSKLLGRSRVPACCELHFIGCSGHSYVPEMRSLFPCFVLCQAGGAATKISSVEWAVSDLSWSGEVCDGAVFVGAVSVGDAFVGCVGYRWVRVSLVRNVQGCLQRLWLCWITR